MKPRKSIEQLDWTGGDPVRRRNANRKFLYGISPVEYDQLLAKQGGRCAVCGFKPGSRQVLVVDHDHKTGHIRGLLCRQCNVGLGMFGDEPGRLLRAVEYLKNS